jgi:hypothetical protein
VEFVVSLLQLVSRVEQALFESTGDARTGVCWVC